MKKILLPLILLLFVSITNESVFAQTQTTNPEVYQVANSSTNVIPLGFTTANNGNKCQFLILASRLSGNKRPGRISKIYFQPGSGYGLASVTFTTFKIALGMTNITSFVGGSYISTGMTQAMNANSITFTGLATATWYGVPLTTSVYWDGVSNIVFEMSQEAYSQALGIYMDHSVSYNSRLWGPTTSATPTGVGAAELSFGFDISFDEPNNAGVDSLMSPDNTGTFCSEEKKEIKVRVKNFGSNSISNVKLNWTLNGVQQPTKNLTFNPPLDSVYGPNNTKVVSLGDAVFHFMQPVKIKAWTTMPNGIADTINTNDTLYREVTSTKQGVTAEVTPSKATICEGSSVVLDAGAQAPGTVFIWSNGAVTQKTLATNKGKYTVTVQSTTGCFAYSEANVTVDPRPIAGDFGIIDLGANNFEFTPTKMQNITYYRWDYGDSSVFVASTSAKQQHRYKKPGAYVVTLTLANSCDTINLIKQIFVHPQGNTGIESTELENPIKLYPNPANKFVTIDAANEVVNRVEVYNMLGQKVMEKNIGKSGKIHLELDALNVSGVYNFVIFTKSNFVSKKVNLIK